jgi:hypothetical protein
MHHRPGREGARHGDHDELGGSVEPEHPCSRVRLPHCGLKTVREDIAPDDVLLAIPERRDHLCDLVKPPYLPQPGHAVHRSGDVAGQASFEVVKEQAPHDTAEHALDAREIDVVGRPLAQV